MVFVGIDVGSTDGVVVTRHNSKSGQATRLDNTAEGHPSLLAHGKKHSEPMHICLEATGVYHLD